MKYVPFILKHLRRDWIRTGSTVAAMSVCVFLFCTLAAVIEALTWGLKSAHSSRLVTRHALSLANSVPVTYRDRIAAVPGVTGVAVSTFFLGFQGSPPDLRRYFPNFAVGESYFQLHPELDVPPDQMEAYLRDRRGCIIGSATARKFGWKLGDTFQLESVIPPYRRPAGPFEFVVRGIYEADEARYPGTDKTMMFFHYEYLVEGTGRQVTTTKAFSVAIADPAQASTVAQAIDALFENSERPTRTETEAAFQAGITSMAGNLVLLLKVIGLAVASSILIVTANTMSMAVRERRTEIGVLKTLGFPGAMVMLLILAEGALLGAFGGGLGIALSRLVIRALPAVPVIGGAFSQYPGFGLSLSVAAAGFAVAVALGLLSGLLPALTAYRARITETLRAV